MKHLSFITPGYIHLNGSWGQCDTWTAEDQVIRKGKNTNELMGHYEEVCMNALQRVTETQIDYRVQKSAETLRAIHWLEFQSAKGGRIVRISLRGPVPYHRLAKGHSRSSEGCSHHIKSKSSMHQTNKTFLNMSSKTLVIIQDATPVETCPELRRSIILEKPRGKNMREGDGSSSSPKCLYRKWYKW